MKDETKSAFPYEQGQVLASSNLDVAPCNAQKYNAQLLLSYNSALLIPSSQAKPSLPREVALHVQIGLW